MLLENEPPAFKVLNSGGRAPLLIACDHAENRIPGSLGNLGLQDDYLQAHIAYDIGAKQVAIRLSELFDAPLILAEYSRLVIDLNRHLSDPTLIARESDHIVIEGNCGLTEGDKNARIEEIFQAYHNQYSEMVGKLIAMHEKPVIFSVHSFTPRMHGIDRPWHFGWLWDKDAELAKVLLEAFARLPGYTIGDNQPYHAKDPEGYAQSVHASQRGVELALLEIRQDLIAETKGQEEIANLIYQVMRPVITEYTIAGVSE